MGVMVGREKKGIAAVLLLALALCIAGCTFPSGSDQMATPSAGVEMDTGVVTLVEGIEPTEDPTDPDSLPSLHMAMRPQDVDAVESAVEVYSGSFEMNYQSQGLLAKIAKEPLIIDFYIRPKSSNPHLCFFIITVRDADSLEQITENGYNRVYPADTKGRIIIRHPGKYHINLYGAMVTADVTVRQGA